MGQFTFVFTEIKGLAVVEPKKWGLHFQKIKSSKETC